MPKKVLKKKVASKRRKADFGYFIIGVITVVLIAVGILAFKYQNTSQFKSLMNSEESMPPAKNTVYMGKLPCADCEGIDTVLTLSPDNSYSQKMTYIGKDTSFTEKGIWEEKTGIPSNPQARYILLTPSSAGGGEVAKIAYEVIDNMHIQQLDINLNPITDAPYNMTLTKQLAE